MADMEYSADGLWLMLRNTRIAKIDGPGWILQWGDSVTWLPEPRWKQLDTSTERVFCVQDTQPQEGVLADFAKYEYDLSAPGCEITRVRERSNGGLSSYAPWNPSITDEGSLTPEERIEKALNFAITYGQTDGSHHKMWVIDQIVRALVPDYEAFRKDYEEDGEYEWDEGIAP